MKDLIQMTQPMRIIATLIAVGIPRTHVASNWGFGITEHTRGVAAAAVRLEAVGITGAMALGLERKLLIDE